MRISDLFLAEVERIHGDISLDPKRKFHSPDPELEPDFDTSNYKTLISIGNNRLMMFDQMPGLDRDFYLVDPEDNVLYRLGGKLRPLPNGRQALWINFITRAESDHDSSVRAVDIYRALILDLDYILVSDNAQTAAGARLWNQLVSSPGIGHHIMTRRETDTGKTWVHQKIDARKYFMHPTDQSRIVAYKQDSL
jgi:hypothetical protein